MQQFTDYVWLALAGMAGAIIRSLIVHNGSVLLWRKWEKDGKRGVDLGILSSLLIGAAVGIFVDQSPMTAFSWAISGSYIFEELAKKQKTGE